MYTFKVLYSGSDGNAALLRASDGTAVLIDAGRSARTLTAALGEAGVSPDTLSAIFLTHEHRDHTAALDVFIKHHPIPVHTTTASAARIRCTAGEALQAALVEHPPLFSVEINGICFSSFVTPHDSAGSVGYRITLSEGNTTHTLGYATDLGTVTKDVEEGLFGCEAVVLECNHDEMMLREGPYPFDLKRRIASRNGHLSNCDCAAFCARLAAAGTKRFLLAHLSETNNDPTLALAEVKSALAGFPVTVGAAHPTLITEL